MADKYYTNAYNRYKPFMDQSLNDTRAGLADQGLLSSTGGQGKLAGIRQQYLSQASQQAEQSRNADRSFDEQVRQASIGNALRAYEMLVAKQLGQGSIQGNMKGLKMPNQPPSFADLFKRYWKAPIGDPPENEMDEPMFATPQFGDPREVEYWGMHNEGTGKGWRDEDRAQQAADSAAARAAQKSMFDAQMAWEREKAAADKDKVKDPWAEFADNITTNMMQDYDPNNPGRQNMMDPSSLIADFQMRYPDIDVFGELAKGTPEAVAAISRMYPSTTAKYRAQYGDEWYRHFALRGGPSPKSALAAKAESKTTPLQDVQGVVSNPFLQRSGRGLLGATPVFGPAIGAREGYSNLRDLWNWMNTPR